jgi:hypothetical protein
MEGGERTGRGQGEGSKEKSTPAEIAKQLSLDDIKTHSWHIQVCE